MAQSTKVVNIVLYGLVTLLKERYCCADRVFCNKESTESKRSEEPMHSSPQKKNICCYLTYSQAIQDVVTFFLQLKSKRDF